MKNVIERAVVLVRGEYIDHEDLVLSTITTAGDTETGANPRPAGEFQPVSLAEIERIHILATLRSTDWNKSKAASILGIERSTLDRKIRRHQLTSERNSEY
jgi:Nif-specific regulatory protein